MTVDRDPLNYVPYEQFREVEKELEKAEEERDELKRKVENREKEFHTLLDVSVELGKEHARQIEKLQKENERLLKLLGGQN